MNVSKMAAKDAAEYARAQMFFGEGAGIRRKLIENTVAWNVERIDGYHEAFQKALEKQNWSHHATMAVRERKTIDAGKFIKRNARGIITGDRRSMTNGVATVALVYTIMVATGLDEPIKRKVVTEYKIAKLRYSTWKHQRQTKGE